MQEVVEKEVRYFSSRMPHLLSLTSWALENFNHIVEHRAQYKHATYY